MLLHPHLQVQMQIFPDTPHSRHNKILHIYKYIYIYIYINIYHHWQEPLSKIPSQLIHAWDLTDQLSEWTYHKICLTAGRM